MEKKATKTRKKKGGWGGKREGAGRKPGTGHPIKDNPINQHLTFVVTEQTLQRVRQLRALTKGDDRPFNRMFEDWVESLATDYGL